MAVYKYLDISASGPVEYKATGMMLAIQGLADIFGFVRAILPADIFRFRRAIYRMCAQCDLLSEPKAPVRVPRGRRILSFDTYDPQYGSNFQEL